MKLTRSGRGLLLKAFKDLAFLSASLCLEPVLSEEFIRSACTINGVPHSCEVLARDDDLMIRRHDGPMFSARRLGTCRDHNGVEERIRRCNVRITTADDFIYGLLVRSSRDGTKLSSPQLEIHLPEIRL